MGVCAKGVGGGPVHLAGVQATGGFQVFAGAACGMPGDCNCAAAASGLGARSPPGMMH